MESQIVVHGTTNTGAGHARACEHGTHLGQNSKASLDANAWQIRRAKAIGRLEFEFVPIPAGRTKTTESNMGGKQGCSAELRPSQGIRICILFVLRNLKSSQIAFEIESLRAEPRESFRKEEEDDEKSF